MEAEELKRQRIAEDKTRVAEKKTAKETLDNQWRSIFSDNQWRSISSDNRWWVDL